MDEVAPGVDVQSVDVVFAAEGAGDGHVFEDVLAVEVAVCVAVVPEALGAVGEGSAGEGVLLEGPWGVLVVGE